MVEARRPACNNCSLHAIPEMPFISSYSNAKSTPPPFLSFYAHERTFLSSSFFHDSSNPFHLFSVRIHYWKSSIRITDSGCSRFKKRIGFRLGRQSSRLCFQSTAICGVRSRSHSADEEKVARLERLESKMVSLTAILIYSDIYTHARYNIYVPADKTFEFLYKLNRFLNIWYS